MGLIVPYKLAPPPKKRLMVTYSTTKTKFRATRTDTKLQLRRFAIVEGLVKSFAIDCSA